MDPLTHALAGAVAASAVAGRQIGRRALAIGAVAALLPDVDVFIRSASDPLLAIEHHRGFTHSLVFAAVGGALAATPFLRRPERVWFFLAATVAWLSHGLLDAATTYGTQLFWPFSRHRVGLDVISIIDPLFTLILLIGLLAALATRRRLVFAIVIAAAAWLAAGEVQRQRALDAQRRLAALRGDSMTRAAVFPTVGNTVVWRSIYESDGSLHMDRLRVPWLREASYAPSDSVPLARPEHPDERRDFERFAWFSDGWVARAPSDPAIIGDARYSLRASRYDPVWGIRFRGGRTEWVDRTRERDANLGAVWREITGRTVTFRDLP